MVNSSKKKQQRKKAAASKLEREKFKNSSQIQQVLIDLTPAILGFPDITFGIPRMISGYDTAERHIPPFLRSEGDNWSNEYSSFRRAKKALLAVAGDDKAFNEAFRPIKEYQLAQANYDKQKRQLSLKERIAWFKTREYAKGDESMRRDPPKDPIWIRPKPKKPEPEAWSPPLTEKRKPLISRYDEQSYVDALLEMQVSLQPPEDITLVKLVEKNVLDYRRFVNPQKSLLREPEIALEDDSLLEEIFEDYNSQLDACQVENIFNPP